MALGARNPPNASDVLSKTEIDALCCKYVGSNLCVPKPGGSVNFVNNIKQIQCKKGFNGLREFSKRRYDLIVRFNAKQKGSECTYSCIMPLGPYNDVYSKFYKGNVNKLQCYQRLKRSAPATKES